MAEKMRVHILAKELNVPSKVIIQKCKAEGIDTIKNHMSTLSAGLAATIREWFSEGTHDTTVETTQRVDVKKVRIKRRAKKATASETAEAEGAMVGVAVAEPPPTVAADIPSADESPTTPVGVEDEPSEVDVAPVEAEPPPPAPTEVFPAAAAAEAPPPTPPMTEEPAEQVEPLDTPIIPAGPQNVPTKVKLQGPRVVRYEAPERELPRVRRSPAGPGRSSLPGGGPDPELPTGPEGPGKPGDRDGARRKGRGGARRSAGRAAGPGEHPAEWGDRDLAERKERLAGATGRRIRRRTGQGGAGGPAVPSGPKVSATVGEPVKMKEFCSATGLNFMQCFKVLRDEHQLVANVNMTISTEVAELLSLHFGIELTVVPLKTRLDEVREEFAGRERMHLTYRPPVVTMLGHVDHGKTSLLDAIRSARVVAGEDGGITQHMGAYHLETSHGAVTFLDTPGHEAFTAMRARGAELTDVVVLVVAADDGLMPQTIEAINHAKAAEVPIVVALNKIDLGDQNKIQIYGQLAEHELTPSGDWGGEVDVIETSATTGLGIRELVDHLADLSSLMDFKADATLPAMGSVIEAETKSGVGAVVRVLVQEGTLHVGDFIVCGSAFGKVRALSDDRGNRIKSAGPSIPVEVWGLDDVPTAGDRLYALDSLQRAKEIATETKQTRVDRSRIQSRKVKTLEEMVLQKGSDEVPELNVIIKADVDGSVAALQHSLGSLPSNEVRLAVRHAGVGAVNDGDILLAAACSGIVIAFRVDSSVKVRRLAEQHGVDVRPYRVIYDARDDIKKALEGLLEPEEKFESRGSVEVRQVFHMGKKIGMIAGSFVVSGTIERSQFGKIVRDGVIVRDRCRFASLRRFKDDVREVRAGLECGIRLEGFDDLHVGDIIESYDVLKVARTL